MLDWQKSLAHKYSGLQVFSFNTMYSVGRMKAPSPYAWIMPLQTPWAWSRTFQSVWAGPKDQSSLFHRHQVSLLHSTHTALGTIVSYPLVTGGKIPRNEQVLVWIWPFTSIQSQNYECVELYLHPPIKLKKAHRLTIHQDLKWLLLNYQIPKWSISSPVCHLGSFISIYNVKYATANCKLLKSVITNTHFWNQ